MKKTGMIERIGIKYGLMTLAGLVGLFLIMQAAGLVYMVELRALNLFILVGGISLALNEYKKKHFEEMNYLRSLSLGTLVSATAVLPFAIFTMAWLNFDAAFMGYIKENAMFGRFLNPFILGAVILLEGMISGFIYSYAIMQYMKKSVMREIKA